TSPLKLAPRAPAHSDTGALRAECSPTVAPLHFIIWGDSPCHSPCANIAFGSKSKNPNPKPSRKDNMKTNMILAAGIALAAIGAVTTANQNQPEQSTSTMVERLNNINAANGRARQQDNKPSEHE